tara:strand:- start:7386 stop:8585 length:1200 start_codon:yes stop_codon:yes gene_type:complete
MMTEHIQPDERKTAAVLGVGRMGTVISYAMKELGFFVVGVDNNESAAVNFRKRMSANDGTFYRVTESGTLDENAIAAGVPPKDFRYVLSHEKPDIVISSLPYHQTEEVAAWCIENSLRYCDLGGRVDVSERINKLANEKAKAPVMTDLGLAPGWVNILAEHACKEIHGTPDEVLMMVGGIPGTPNNPPLNYACTWSTDGLLNEYADDCEILSDGEIKKVKGMDGLIDVEFNKLKFTNSSRKIEAFYTSGGASHTIKDMKERGVKNCAYRTMRWKGHGDIIKLLIRQCDLSRKCLEKIFEKGCPHTEGDPDLVLIKVKVTCGKLVWSDEIIIGYDSEFSAMQKSTAFSISAVASQMAEGMYDGKLDQHRDYWTEYPKALSYKHINYKDFSDRLNKLGIQL